MSKKQIRLRVAFTATYFDPDNPIPYNKDEAKKVEAQVELEVLEG